MTRFAFLLTRRWAGIVALAVVVAAVCGALGYWQLTRHQSRAEQVALVEANYGAAAVPLAELLPEPDLPLPASLAWRPVTVHGEYVGTASLILPQRPVEGSPADHVVAVVAARQPDGGTWLVTVDRGWYRTDDFSDHAAERAQPDGEVVLTLRLRPAEPPTPRRAPPGEVYALSPAQVTEAVLAAADGAGGADRSEAADGVVVTGAYGWLVREEPSTAGAPAGFARPTASLGSHLSYAFQWWVFGVGALVGTVVLARREAGDAAAPDGAAPVPRPRRRSAEEVEDELIDAQLRRRG